MMELLVLVDFVVNPVHLVGHLVQNLAAKKVYQIKGKYLGTREVLQQLKKFVLLVIKNFMHMDTATKKLAQKNANTTPQVEMVGTGRTQPEKLEASTRDIGWTLGQRGNLPNY